MRRTSRAAFTLVEMLVAMAVTLVMMGAVVTLFGNIGNSISGSRASMEMSERVRNARNVLQHDLGNITVTAIPSRRPEMDEGYLEIIEGTATDFWPNSTWPSGPGSPPPNGSVPFPAKSAAESLAGDVDDVLFFTVRSRNEPYTGVTNGASMQSHTAEVAYFTAIAPNTPTIIDSQTGLSFQLRTLYRRVLLVSPGNGNVAVGAPIGTLQQYHDRDDISARLQGSNFVPNTLGDLTKRENRYGHNPSAFPFPANQYAAYTDAFARGGDDVLLNNVLSFDVRVYDPNVPVLMTTGGVATLPSDPGYSLSSNTPAGTGGYVDLFYNRYTSPSVQGSSFGATAGSNAYLAQAAGLRLPLATYDTWSMHYEQNGIDENIDTVIDSATNGLDDNNNGIVDEPAELEAPAPYPVPLRGIQIKIRVYEPDSRQVREVTVVQDFLPQ